MWRLIDNKRHRGSGGWPHPLPASYRPTSRSAAPVTSHCTRSVEVHPIRRGAPDPSRCTRYVAMHPIRRGAMPTDRVHRRPQQAQPRAIPPHRPLPSASDAATRPRHAHPGSERETLHPFGSVTPPPSWCNTTKQHAQSRTLPPDTPQPAASDAATRPRHAHPDSEREALHQLGSVTPPPSWCNTQLSGVTPLSNKYQCGNMPRLSSQITRQRSSAATEETVHHRETGTGDEAANSSTHQLLGHSNTRTTCACQRLRSLCGDSHAISSLLRHTSSHGR